MEKMYHLFKGSSEDGQGTPRYVGRTTLERTAQSHLAALLADPYSFGHVIWYDEKTQHVVSPYGGLDNL